MLSAREAAIKAISSYRKSGAWSEIFLDNFIKKENLSEKDAALASNITLGTISNLYFLDYYISLYCNTPIKKLHPTLIDILRISEYQLIFLDKIPPSAVVNEGVALTKKLVNERAGSLANAVLRKISQNAKDLPEIKKDSFSEYLSVKYSFPLWYVEEILKYFENSEAEKYFKSCTEIPAITIHTNTLKITPDSLEEELKKESITYIKNDKIRGSFDLYKTGDISKLDIFKKGYAYVQDNSAYLASLITEAKAGDKVIDVCAAPGGKSVTAAILMGNKGSVLSCDIHEKKLSRVMSNAKNLGIDIIETKCLDGRTFIPEYENFFDIVIADVPCSGYGVVRKKPEIRYKKDEDTASLCGVQTDILNNVSKYVKPSGILVYSTCTVLKRENEDIVNGFLERNTNFEPVPFSVDGVISAENGMATIWPHINNFDGFFTAKLRRKA